MLAAGSGEILDVVGSAFASDGKKVVGVDPTPAQLATALVNLVVNAEPESLAHAFFLVGDAPPHMDYAQDTKYPVTLKVAKQKDIIVNAVLAGDARDTERVWRDIAQNGNGRFIPIPQDGGQVVAAKILVAFGADRTAVDRQGRVPAMQTSFAFAAKASHAALAAAVAVVRRRS